MEYRELGNTGIRAGVIGMGCEGFFEEHYSMTKKLFDFAEENGINYFDLYASDPEVRAAVGNALAGRREKFYIQSHLCSIWENGQYLRTRDLKKVKNGFEESLRLLKTDHIDVGIIHYCDSLRDYQDILDHGILEYAQELKKKGTILHIGLSSHNPEVARKAVESGEIEVLMFSVNPCYDLQPAGEDVEQLWNDDNYKDPLVNMNPEREQLYETCQRKGVGITVMKAFGGGDLLSEQDSEAGVALTVTQCLSYALSRPAVASVMCGAHSVEELRGSLHYLEASDAERDYAAAFTSFPRISWKGHCMYCNHCLPCPKHIDIASVTKFYNLTKNQSAVPETVREHYALLSHHASECVRCGACETRCPFEVPVRENMQNAAETFGF